MDEPLGEEMSEGALIRDDGECSPERSVVQSESVHQFGARLRDPEVEEVDSTEAADEVQCASVECDNLGLNSGAFEESMLLSVRESQVAAVTGAITSKDVIVSVSPTHRESVHLDRQRV